METLGTSITGAKGTRFQALSLADFTTVETDRRVPEDVIAVTPLWDTPLVGFMNKCSTTTGITTPLFPSLTLGFGNDAEEMVYAVFDDLSDENPDAGMTLVIENQVHDTYELELTVQVEDYSGVVLTLTHHRITLNVGDDFDPYSYIGYAHDAEGIDLTDNVTVDSGVDTDAAGDYEVWYWVQDNEGTYSPTKKLYVTVEAAPEETGEAGEAEEGAP